MKKLILVFLFMALLFTETADAQSTAVQVVMGYLTTSGCPTFQPCFFQYSTSSPMPVYLPLGH